MLSYLPAFDTVTGGLCVLSKIVRLRLTKNLA